MVKSKKIWMGWWLSDPTCRIWDMWSSCQHPYISSGIVLISVSCSWSTRLTSWTWSDRYLEACTSLTMQSLLQFNSSLIVTSLQILRLSIGLMIQNLRNIGHLLSSFRWPENRILFYDRKPGGLGASEAVYNDILSSKSVSSLISFISFDLERRYFNQHKKY